MPKTYRLRLTRLLDAPRRRVFRAWADPNEMRRFLRPHEDWTTPSLRADARVGGRYRLTMRAPDGTTYATGGVYRVVKPYERLTFTWTWEDGHTAARFETEVTVLLRAEGAKTRLTLIHDLLPSAAERDGHREGWTGCLRCLRAHIEGGV